MLSDNLLRPLTESLTLSAPMCATCAFEPYCGADPVFHHATMGNDFTGHKALSAFCQRNMGVFILLLTEDARRALLRRPDAAVGAMRTDPVKRAPSC